MSNAILLVEDNEINQILVMEMLSRENHEVTIANNGHEALQILDNKDFALVLMDLRMPVMDGYEAIKRIRQHAVHSHLPVICLSASAQVEDRDTILSHGFDDHVAKPIDFEHLRALLQKYLCTDQKNAASTLDETQATTSSAVNWEAALRHHADDRSLLIRLLKEFFRYYADVPDDIEALLSQEKRVDAERLAHNIKGLCGSFGATNMHRTAEAIEYAIRDQSSEVSAAMEDFRKAHGVFTDEARAFIEG